MKTVTQCLYLTVINQCLRNRNEAVAKVSARSWRTVTTDWNSTRRRVDMMSAGAEIWRLRRAVTWRHRTAGSLQTRFSAWKWAALYGNMTNDKITVKEEGLYFYSSNAVASTPKLKIYFHVVWCFSWTVPLRLRCSFWTKCFSFILMLPARVQVPTGNNMVSTILWLIGETNRWWHSCRHVHKHSDHHHIIQRFTTVNGDIFTVALSVLTLIPCSAGCQMLTS